MGLGIPISDQDEIKFQQTFLLLIRSPVGLAFLTERQYLETMKKLRPDKIDFISELQRPHG